MKYKVIMRQTKSGKKEIIDVQPIEDLFGVENIFFQPTQQQTQTKPRTKKK